METVLITGANRGVGLALTSTFLASGYRVLATYRSEATKVDLEKLMPDGDLSIFQLDVSDEAAIADLAEQLKEECIDILFNNAGIFGPQNQSLESSDTDGWLQTFTVNAIAPFNLSRAFLKQLGRSGNPRIITVTSQLGALHFPNSGYYAYSSSKAAANKVMQVLALELKDRGITVCPVHPGWVKTDMGGPNAEISPDKSAAGLVKLAGELTLEQTGQFFTWSGDIHEW